MKTTITLLLLLIISQCCFSQTAYYDALRLKAYIIDGKFSGIEGDPVGYIKILRNYVKGEETMTDVQIKNFLARENRFLEQFITPGGAAAAANSGKIAGIASSVGNLDVTSLADGFAKFLVKRTKEELNAAFFSRFSVELEKYPDAQLLFPQTYTTLKAIGTNIYNYEAFIIGLRESFEKDLNGLTKNLPKIINDGRYSTFFVAHPELKSICLSSLYIGNGLLDKEHPGNILADFDITMLDGLKDKTTLKNNVKASVQTLQLFSNSLRSSGSENYWVSPDSLKLLANDAIILKIYFGLIYQQASDIEFGSDSLRVILKKMIQNDGSLNATPYIKYLTDFIKQTNSLTNSIKNISGKERDKLTFTDYYDFYNSSLDLFEYSTQVSRLPGLENLSSDIIFIKYINVGRIGGNIAMDINRHNYGSAILNAANLYKEGFLNQRDTDPKSPKVESFILKYGSFIAAVSQAQNSDDVAKAIEAAALPSGSSSIKRNSAFNVSLNAYVGLFYGKETIGKFDKKNIDFNNWNSYGITAPIGVAVSFAPKKIGSFSAFISLIDIGAVAAYRFKDDSTSQVPTIQLKNIFSPGLFFSWGIPKTPLSLNIGTQMGPNLRKVYDDNGTLHNNYKDDIYWRFSASLLVDIPLLNFYTKTK